MSTVTVDGRSAGVRFTVRVPPRVSRAEIAGVRQGVLEIWWQLPPVGRAANEAYVESPADVSNAPRPMTHFVSCEALRSTVPDVRVVLGGGAVPLEAWADRC